VADDNIIKEILVEMGVYSLAIACVGSDVELFKMFRDDFDQLVDLCQQ
jgi:hypothetical protein